MPLLETKGAASAQGFGEFAKSGAVNYIEEVFSTYLYTGTGSTQTITNGIDLSGKGGLVWIKGRSGATDHALYDTARGTTKDLVSNSTAAETTQSTGLTAFSSTGFSIGALAKLNTNAATYASWTFREQPKFFDIVTYTGDGANRTIAHNLGSVPGCIIIKRTDTTGAWAVYHRSLDNTEYLVLNTTAAKATGTTYWNSTTPTATEFSLGTATDVNANGGTYVAYLFAHDAGGFGLTGSDNVITCGSFTADSTGSATVTLGYEPQWLLLKRTDAVRNWELLDNMRLFANSKNETVDNIAYINPNLSSAEAAPTIGVQPTATGFGGTGVFINNSTHIYIAIRRGPMKVPTSGTSVFSPVTYTGTGAARSLTAGFPIDLAMFKYRGGTTNSFDWFERLLGTSPDLRSAYNYAELATTTEVTSFASNTQVTVGASYDTGGTNVNGQTYVLEAFQRAPSFFDIVCYAGTGSNTTQTHNLGAVPELMLVKCRGAAADWQVYSASLSNTEYLVLNSTAAKATGTTRWNSTTPTASVFSLGTDATVNAANISTGYYVAYLFATCPGVSKVGSYTGTGALQTVNCGFTGGARFVLIKRTDSTGDWYVYDSARGITSGNDPYLFMNSAAAEVTNTNYVDTDTTGFKVTAAAPAGLNANGGTYIFLAIA